MHANIGGNPAKNQMVHTAGAQNMLQISGEKTALARLVDNNLTGPRLQLWNYFPPRFAPYQNFAARPLLTNPGTDALAAP